MNNIISLGLGVQSTALYLMSSMGILPRVERAIFVDLGKEKKKTYSYLDWLQEWQLRNNGVYITVVKKKNLYQDLLNAENSTGQRFSSIPAYTVGIDGKVGMLRRQCTNEYKIEQVDTAIREYYGVSNLRGTSIRIWKGISMDEIERMSIPEELWKIHYYPFTGYAVIRDDNYRIDTRRMTRLDIVAWFKANGLPIPPKSSCAFCPYQSEESWADMKKNDPDDFEAACLVDEAIRNSSKKGIKNPIFLHESLKPLREVNFQQGNDLWHGECSGECHT